MFFFLPWGHDHPVYERPWVTYALIVVCVAVFAVTATLEADVMPAIDAAAYRLSILHEAFPEARVSFSIEGLPQELDQIVQPLVDTNPLRTPVPGDADLEAAMLDLIAGLNQLPLFRLGFRPGAPTLLGAVAHAFVHADVFHLAGNMLFLWIAGGVLECFWRRWAYVALYVASGLLGLGAQALAAPHSMTPMVGASGCIAGLLGAFLVGYPKTRIKIAWFVLVTFRPRFGSTFVPAWLVLPVWALVELGHAVAAPFEGGGVAYWAHVGGFACGAAVALVARRMKLVASDGGHEIVRGTGEAPPESTLGAPIHNLGQGPRSRSIRPNQEPLPRPQDIGIGDIPAAREEDEIER